MPNCNTIELGEMCEGDGECATSQPGHNNCGAYQVYERPATCQFVESPMVPPAPPPVPSVPPGVFYYHATPLNWTAAEGECVSRGMHLASIRSAAENEWVRRVCASDCWIGFTDAANETAWAWTDGATSPYVNWRAGEPNGQSAEATDHAYMYIDSTPSWAGQWDDEFPYVAKAYVCREPASPPTPPAPPPSAPPPVPSVPPGVFYYHATPLNWTAAEG